MERKRYLFCVPLALRGHLAILAGDHDRRHRELHLDTLGLAEEAQGVGGLHVLRSLLDGRGGSWARGRVELERRELALGSQGLRTDVHEILNANVAFVTMIGVIARGRAGGLKGVGPRVRAINWESRRPRGTKLGLGVETSKADEMQTTAEDAARAALT